MAGFDLVGAKAAIRHFGLYTKPMSMYIYTYACHEDEWSLCQLELRSLFGSTWSTLLPVGSEREEIGFSDASSHGIKETRVGIHEPKFEAEARIFHSEMKIDPSRSPFLKERIEVLIEGDSHTDIVAGLQSSGLQLNHNETFKVRFIKTNDLSEEHKIEFAQARQIERAIGLHIRGKADMHQPSRIFGVVPYRGRWYFGACIDNQSIWLQHIEKPQQYTMALPTRTARAIVNIAVPDPIGKRVIDPCCGIGTVLIEALSMGINIVGRDINPLVVRGTRDNLAHFDLHTEVTLGSIAGVTEHYDVAIVDMPYNIVSKISLADSLSILQHARRIADRVLIISIEPIDDTLTAAGFTVIDRCVAKKAAFTRHIRICT